MSELNQEKKEKYEMIINKYNNNDFTSLERTEENKEIFHILDDKKIIKITKNGNIQKIVKQKIHLAKLQKNDNFGFAIINNHDDLYIRNVKEYFNADYVLIIETSDDGSSDAASILGLLHRTENKLIVKKRGNSLEPLEININKEIKLIGQDFEQIKNGDILSVNIEEISNKNIKVTLDKIITDQNDPDQKMKIILSKYNIDVDFDEQTLKEIETIEDKIQNSEKNDRQDLREQVFFTIDGEDSKDLDDAISLIKEDEKYRLYVSIADVSHYVREDSALDKDAKKRGTSVYFIDRVVPMLPKKISNGICSLHPGVDRLTLTCEMLIDKTGKILSKKIYKTIINSKYRLTYTDMNKILQDHDKELIEKYSDIYGILLEMNKLKNKLNKKRLGRGSFNLEDAEAKFKIKDNKLVDIYPLVRGESEKLIEEFAIVANESVTEIIASKGIPFIYRIHDTPNKKKLESLKEILYYLKIKTNIDLENIKPKDFKKIFDSIEDDTIKRVISKIIVRSMAKAIYSTDNIGHFGLASDNYTHFTSPIRRYPDLEVHRIIKRFLENEDQIDIEELNLVARDSSEKEIAAIKSSQEIEDYEKAKYMKKFVNEIFKGIVVSIEDYGIFVELPNTIRGLIRFRDINKYKKVNKLKVEFFDDIELHFGDTIKVVIGMINEDRGQIDFLPVDKKYYDPDKIQKQSAKNGFKKKKDKLVNDDKSGKKNRKRKSKSKKKRNFKEGKRKSKDKKKQ